ncbi:MAG: hypothetical protein IE909_19210 [Campylobacterales bacterium]|nr:hypothetical protein [Campylobacterales bacterium]
MFVFSNNSIIAKAYPYFKWSVYFLLFINMILFFKTQTITEGIESLAWLVLLMLFEWETTQLNKPYISVHEKRLVFVLKMIAYIFVVYSAYDYTTPEYIKENGKLDMYNTITWLLAVILIEYDVYFPGKYYRTEWIIRNILKVILYSILFIVAVLWWIDGEFFDFYDAFLWIICFFFIELNILKFEEEEEFEDE